MKELNKYIVEKLKVNKDVKAIKDCQDAYEILIKYFKEKVSDDNLYKITLRESNDTGKRTIVFEFQDKLYKKEKDWRSVITHILDENNIYNYSCGRWIRWNSGEPWHFSLQF